MRTNLIASLLTLMTFFITSACFAKTLNLYEQPKTDAKVVGKIDTEAGFVPIFTPKNSDWMKVGDPSNGNVGWVQSKELSSAGSNTGFTFSQQVVNTEAGPQSYVVKFGTPKSLSQTDAKKLISQMETRQKQVQADMEKMIQEMFGQPGGNMPIFMPIIIMPSEKPTNTK